MAPNNALPIWGNEKTMNLNSMILTNVQSSPYFKVNLFGLKTYHEVIDEIYYKVNHLEPWEKGSRKTAGQTGMCGGVRGVGAGGIVSTAFCILYKLYTLKLTRKQVIGLMTHNDSPYIRALGFMYIRYTQPPADLWEWYEEYLTDDEEVDVKAGGGHVMTIGEMLRQWLTKLEWYSTLFPRIPVPVQKLLDQQLRAWEAENLPAAPPVQQAAPVRAGGRHIPDEDVHFGEAERLADSSDRRRPGPGGGRPSPPFDIARAFDQDKGRERDNTSRNRDKDPPRRSRSKDRDRQRKRSRSRSKERRRKRSRSRERQKSRDRHRSRSKDRQRSRDIDRHRDRDRDRHSKKRRSKSRERKRSRSRDRRRSRSKDRRDRKRSRSVEKTSKKGDRENSFERDLKREIQRHKKDENGS